MAEAVDIDAIDFEDGYDKADPIDDMNLDKLINELNRSIREQEELESRLLRTEWSSMNEDERRKSKQQIAFNEKEPPGTIHHESFKNNLIDLTQRF